MEQQVPRQPDAAAAMWPLCQQAGQADAGSVSSYLDFLSDDLLGATHNPLDACTLAAVAAAQDPPGEAKRKRMKREEIELGSNGEEDLSDDDEDEPRGKSGKRKASAAAQNKANREKARREKINDRHVLTAVHRQLAAAQQQTCLWTSGRKSLAGPLLVLSRS
eukprot:GHRQ01012582.1.p1 GENE.GHRQ01012582.1~~GHRQ01012582.1.p1  ORF type:complete len:185 (+),score=46.93 GHRQ01012582.1:69-557(+)